MTPAYPGKAKLVFARRLGDSWHDLADLLEIPRYERDRFPRGHEAASIWVWLEDRDRLGLLPGAFETIGRADLAGVLGADRTPVSHGPGTDLAGQPPPEPRTASGWSLHDDGELETHWLPRARGADPDSGGTRWYFRGRRTAIERVTGFLTTPGAPRAPLVVTGEPGSGKSSLMAHVLVLADPVLRRQMPQRYRTAGTERLTGAVDAAVRATGKTIDQVTAELAAAARLEGANRERLVAALHGRADGFRIVIDGLDEAQPDHIRPIAVLLHRLSRDPDEHGIRVVVSVRRAPAGSTLTDITNVMLGVTAATTVEVDRPPYLELGDVVEYVRGRLEGTYTPQSRSPYAGHGELAGRVAQAVATRAGGNFLVAQLTSRNLAEDDDRADVSQRRWWAAFPTDVEGAMDQYIARFGGERRQRYVRELLAPLAFALGDGLPDNDLWASAATALSQPAFTYSTSDVHTILDQAATYLIASSQQDRRTYRLFHDALAQYLRARCRKHNPEAHIVRSWRASVPARPDGRPNWPGADPYLLAHLAQHAAQCGELDSLAEDAQFVATAEPAGLVPALRRVQQPTGRQVARAYRQLPYVTAGPAERAAYLALSAQQLADTELRDAFLGCGLSVPWSVKGGAWRPPDEHEIADRLEDGTTATTVVEAHDGSAAIVTGDSDGVLRVRELANGIAEITAVHRAHEASVSAIGGAQLRDGRNVVCSGAADGGLRLWHLDMGLLVPFGPPAGTHRAAVSAVAVAELPFGPVAAACDQAGTLTLALVLAGGALRVLATGEVPGIRHVAVYNDGGSPAVAAGTSRGDAGVYRPDGRGGFHTESLAGTGRWSIGAVAAAGQPAVVAFGTGGRELYICQSHAGSLVRLAHGRDAASSGISAVALVSDGPGTPRGGVLTGDHDGMVQFWAVDEDGNLALRRRGRPHQDEVEALGITRTKAGALGVSCGRDRKVAIWDLLPAPDDLYGRLRDVDVAAASRGTGSVSILIREGAGVERWVVRSDTPAPWPLPEDSRTPQGVRVTGTVDHSGVSRAFRSGLDVVPSQPAARWRPVPVHPVRALAVGDIDGELMALALNRDGKLRVYGGDDLSRPRLEVATGVETPISVSLGYSATGSPIVACGDTDGQVRLRNWPGLGQWADAPVWSLGRADIRTAISGSLLLTGDAMGEVTLCALSTSGPRQYGPAIQPHEAPVTAVALAEADARGFAITGDRAGTVVVSRVHDNGLDPRPSHQITLNSTVLSIAALALTKALIWCRQGALIIQWPTI